MRKHYQNEGVWGVPPRVAYLSSLCVCVCVWRGGVDALGGGWAEKVCCCCPAGVGCLGGGDFRGEFRVTGHAGKRSPERDLRIGMFRGRPASLLLLFVRFWALWGAKVRLLHGEIILQVPLLRFFAEAS